MQFLAVLARSICNKYNWHLINHWSTYLELLPHPLKQKPGVPVCLHQEKPELIDPNMSARSWPIRGWRIILHSRCTKRTPDIDRQQMIRSSLKKIVGAAKITLEKGNGFLSIYSVWKLWNIYSDSFRCQSQRCCGTSSYRGWGLSIDQRW